MRLSLKPYFRKIHICALVMIAVTLGTAGLAYGAGKAVTYSEYAEQYASLAPLETWAIELDVTQYIDGMDVTPREDGLYTSDASSVTYAVIIPEAGVYNIIVEYKPIAGGITITRRLLINDELPFAEAENLVFERFYKNANQDYKTQSGNQIFPTQVEAEVWREKRLSAANGFIAEPYGFYLDMGINTLTFEALDSALLIRRIALIPAEALPGYDAYIASWEASGARRVSGVDAVKIQAEDADLKSSPSLYPANDRTSSLLEPYHPTYIVLNVIGSGTWNTPGQLIEWAVEVPEAGLYRIAFKAKQATSRGTFSTRRLRVNGAVPFAEAEDIRFNYNTRFSIGYLGGDNGDYYIYLNEGVNYISLEATMGVYGRLAERVAQSLSRLNEAYRDIIVVTGSSPDKYRDYQLHLMIPDLFPRLALERNRLVALTAELNEISGSYAVSTLIIDRLISVMNRMVDTPLDIAIYLNDFKSGITALGDWVINVQDQPLTIDYFIVAPEGYTLPRADDNFWERVKHGFLAFMGSFTNKFNASPAEDDKEHKTIEVWVSTGHDQYQILQRLINEGFTPASGVNVDIRLVSPDTVFPATLTGRGPDVSIQLAASTPINFGYRGGAYDLRSFPDFDEVAERFLPAAIDSFTYKGQTFALPDQMSFPVLFYRTDIFEKLGLTLPDTLDDFLGIVPILQQSNMDIYFTTVPQTTLGAMSESGSSRNVNPVYMSLLYQNGGELYYNEGESSAITSEVGVAAFKRWTELFTKHGFIVETDFVTRFRMGEIPVGIVDFTVYNTLSAAAPEILGDWAIASIPGTAQADGSVRYDTPLTLSGSVIIKNTVERKNTVDESWEFLKWWTSAETQYAFALEMESLLGLAGRYPVANLEAFNRIAWGRDNMRVLTEALEWARAVPQVPGSYITGRVIENAFLEIVTDGSNRNATDVIYEAVWQINRELTSKRAEFGITD